MLQYTRNHGVPDIYQTPDIYQSFVSHALIHVARNAALSRIRPDATHVLMMDDDMVAEDDAIVRLLENDEPVVSALTTNRIPPIHLIPQVWDGSLERYLPMESVNLKRPVTGNFAVGGAFLLLRRDAIDALVNDYLTAGDWMREQHRMFDRMAVKRDHREREQRRRAEKRQFRYNLFKELRIFNFPVDDDEAELSEDFALSDKIRALGFKTTIDGTVRIGHMGEYPFGVWDIFYREELQKLIREDCDYDPRQFMPANVRAMFDEILREKAA